jgi:methyl-accepting chemotaxis protein
MKVTSVRAKLLLVLIPLICLCFGVLSGVSYYLASRALNNSINENAISISHYYAEKVQSHLNEKIIQLEDLASIQQVCVGNDREKIVEALIETKRRTGSFSTMFYSDPAGHGVFYDGTVAYAPDREYMKKVITTQKPVISEPVVSRTTGKLSVIFAVPVVYNGKLTGVIGATYTLEKLSELVKEIRFQDTGYGYIVDNSGLVIAHPNNTFNAKLNLSEKKVNPDLTFPTTELDDRLINLFKNAAEGGKQVVGKYELTPSKPNAAIFTPIELPGSKDWVIVIAAPESEVTNQTTILGRMMIGLSLIFIIVAAVFIIFFSKRLVEPLKRLLEECLLLEQGDLREREAKTLSQDEIGKLAQGFRKMRTNMRILVMQVQEKVKYVASTSEELSVSAEQSAQAADMVAVSINEVSQGTEKQLKTVHSTTAFVEKISAGIQQVASNVLSASMSTEKTKNTANRGEQAVAKAVNQMTIIEEKTMNTANVISDLEEKSKQIGQIIEVISNIAGQTNLLALNAAIEAAKAGEQGRGFAVVADEVRKLAEQSQGAAQEITSLISEIWQKTNHAVVYMNEGKKEVSMGTEVVNIAGQYFREILGMIEEVSGQIREISSAIEQISNGSKQVVSAVQEIDSEGRNAAGQAQTVAAATEEQAASMQEIRTSSQNLAKLANDLQNAVASFRLK